MNCTTNVKSLQQRETDVDIPDAGRLSQRQSKRSDSTDRQSARDPLSRMSQYSFMELLPDKGSHRKHSPSAERSPVHRANVSQHSSRMRRRLQSVTESEQQ